jgi:hypothetical protein
MTEAPHRPDPNPGIQARESVGGTTCSPRPAGEPSTVTRDRAYLEDPAVAFWIVQEGERVPVAARPLGSSHPFPTTPWNRPSHACSRPTLTQDQFSKEQCTRGALLAPTKAEGAAVLTAHHAGVAEATAYLGDHLGTRRSHGGHEHVSGQGLLAVGFDHRTSREGDPLPHPTWWWPTGRRGRTDAGQRWTAGTCIGIGWPPTPSTGPATAPAVPDARGRVDGRGRLREPGAGGPARGPDPAGLQANGPD